MFISTVIQNSSWNEKKEKQQDHVYSSIRFFFVACNTIELRSFKYADTVKWEFPIKIHDSHSTVLNIAD
jgi:hypothetical protein